MTITPRPDDISDSPHKRLDLLVRAGAPLEVLIVLSLFACAGPEEVQQSFGYRAGFGVGDGRPANDLPVPAELVYHRDLGSDWTLGVGLMLAEGDFEDPARLIGLNLPNGAEPIDATASYIQLTGWFERDLIAGDSSRLYGLVGGGLADVSVDDATGPTAGGGQFDIRTDAGTELLGAIGLGWQYSWSAAWSFDAVARWQHHFADWEVVDSVSGARDTIGAYGQSVLLVGLRYAF